MQWLSVVTCRNHCLIGSNREFEFLQCILGVLRGCKRHHWLPFVTSGRYKIFYRVTNLLHGIIC